MELRKAESLLQFAHPSGIPWEEAVGGAGRGGQGAPGAHCRLAQAALCPPAGQHVLLPLSPTVLQHPGEQHRQSVRPADHSQVSVGSALAAALS